VSGPQGPVEPMRAAERPIDPNVRIFSSRAQLAEAVGRLVDAGVPLRQLTDHGTHLAVYLSDPDGNDLELAWDRPFDEWPRADDSPAFIDAPLDLDELLADRIAM